MIVLCVEDELRIGRYLHKLTGEILGDRLGAFHHFADLDEAESFIAERPVDVVLLDLDLGGASGFDLLERSAAGAYLTIIVSANTDRALQAFEFGVVDFVPKPFDRERLQQAFGRVMSRGERASACRFLCVQQSGALRRVALDDVRYIRGSGNYSELHLVDGRVWLHHKNLERLELTLPADHHRIHKSYIVSERRISSLQAQAGSRYQAVLDDGSTLPVGRLRYRELKARLFPDPWGKGDGGNGDGGN